MDGRLRCQLAAFAASGNGRAVRLLAAGGLFAVGVAGIGGLVGEVVAGASFATILAVLFDVSPLAWLLGYSFDGPVTRQRTAAQRPRMWPARVRHDSTALPAMPAASTMPATRRRLVAPPPVWQLEVRHDAWW